MDEDVLDVARTIRPYLEQLVGADAPEYDRRIAELLGSAQGGRDADDELMSLLSGSAELHAWAAQVLADEWHRPPDLQPVSERTYDALPTPEPTTVSARKFRCPQGDYVWWRRFVDRDPPRCPSHDTALVPCDR
ncbi:hypothetical protein [Plantactinospora sp. DSM 117369]